ncbi:MAG: family 2 encapsulin nanocompartment cargo protein polyprenyl transferase [Pseudonocardiaceae bacterium]
MTTVDVPPAEPAIRPRTEGRSAPEVLAWSRDLVGPALRSAVDTLPSSMLHIAGYHFGWWDEHGHPLRVNGGKAIRPALVLLSAQAVCGTTTAALPAAVAVELVHNHSLLHDDVMDADLTRRHRPTAWSVFGVNAAILAGNALLALALEVLAASGHPAATDGIRMLSAAEQDLLEGQSADLSFEQRANVELAECVRMAEGKTASLLGCACAVGAAFGGGHPEQVAQLRGFGVRLGLAFQHVDDLLGIWGDPAVTGKPVHSDLRSQKKSLPVVAALTSGTPAGHELATFYHRAAPLSETDLAHAAELIDIAGGRAWSQTQAQDLLAEAMRELHSARPAPRTAGELSALARLATHRDH